MDSGSLHQVIKGYVFHFLNFSIYFLPQEGGSDYLASSLSFCVQVQYPSNIDLTPVEMPRSDICEVI